MRRSDRQARPGQPGDADQPELLAQGTGNVLVGLIGGIPITQVIVRSSANIQSGGKTKVSAIVHGFLLVISVLTIPTLLNKIPLSVLAAVLFIVGYKLAKPAAFKAMYDLGWKQFVPYIVTIVGIVFIDLLWGIGLGLAVGIIIILYRSYQNSHVLHRVDSDSDRHEVGMTLAEQVTFFNKAAILRELDDLPDGSLLTIDARQNVYLDYDVIEILQNFSAESDARNIDIKVIRKDGEYVNPDNYLQLFDDKRRSDTDHLTLDGHRK